MLDILNSYFLNYQKEYIEDDSLIKIAEKSRRIGGTYMQSFEDVDDIIKEKQYTHGRPVKDVYFSSKDELAGKEYIDYCGKWSKIHNVAAHDLGTQVVDEDKGIKARVIEYDNGGKIHALTSAPTAFNSKGGKIVWDEMALHNSQKQMWSGAKPAAMWGYPIRMLSTHKGLKTLFYQFVQDTKDGKTGWSIHTIDIHRAVADGLVDKIFGHTTTEKERQEWLEKERRDCRDEDIWQEDYCCNPRDATTAYLTYEVIMQCEKQDLLLSLEQLKNYDGALFAGWDIARKRDFSVVIVLEKIGLQYIVRHIHEMEKVKTPVQKRTVGEFLKIHNIRRMCTDQTGMGIPITEDMQELYGEVRVEGVTFTNQSKEVMASTLKGAFEDVSIIIPEYVVLRDSCHSIQKIVTAAGNIRYDADRTDSTGHADHFWALALAYHAANSVAACKTWATSQSPWYKKRSEDIQQELLNSYGKFNK